MRTAVSVMGLLAACALSASLALAEEGAPEKSPSATPPAERFALLPGQNCIPTYAVPYIERNGVSLTTDLYVPKGDGPYPGIVLIHGGAWTIGSSATVMGHGRKFAEAGYAVAAINYRKAPKDKFPAQIEDVRDAIAWFRKEAKRFKLDPERVGVWGYSAGGHLAALAAVTETDTPEKGPRIRAVVAGGAPVDFSYLPPDSDMLSYWLGGTPKEKPDIYRQATPLGFVTKDDPPFLFFHGADDSLVPKAGPKRMAEQLQQAGVSAEYYEIPKAGHLQAHWDSGAFRESLRFFNSVLKPK